jgi:integrase/recombinase XerD
MQTESTSALAPAAASQSDPSDNYNLDISNRSSLVSRKSEPDLQGLLEQYLTQLRDYRNCSPKTVVAYRDDLVHFVGFCHEQGLTVPGDLERRHVHQYAAVLPSSGKKGPLAPASVARKIHALRSWFNFLCDMGALQSNLTVGLRLPKREHRMPRVPTDEECEAILGAAWTPREKAIIGLMLMGGLRRGEVLGLNVEDLSADYAQILVRGKGHKERVVPLCPALRDLLIAHLDVRGVSPSPLFLGRTGQRMTETSFVRLFRRVLKRVGLQGEGITPHKLRHAFGTTLVREGVDVATIAELMGHSNISTTSVYLHASPTTMRAAVERLRWGTDR